MAVLVEAALVVAAPWPLVAAVWRRQTRTPGRPLRPLYVAVTGALAWGAVVLLLTTRPAALHVVAGLTVTGLALWWWRQRPAYGRRRGLPPGSLRPLEASLWGDPLALCERARRHGPVFKMQPTLEPFVCVLGFELARDLLREHGDGLAARQWPATREVPGGFLRFMRGDAHRRVRRHIVAAMRADLVGPNTATLRRIARCGLARLAEPDAIAQRVALRDMAEAWLAVVLFGIGPDDPLLPRLRACLPAPEDRDRTPRIGACQPGATAAGIALLRTENGEPANPACVMSRLPIDARGDDVLGNLFMMLQVGAFDLASLLRWLLYYLGHHPDLRARLREAAPPARATLARACVQETLRLDQAEAVMRKATADIRFAGWTIPKGWGVRICLREPHRDPAAFVRPDAYEPDRFLTQAPTAATYAPFGLGAHACVAAELVVALGGLLVAELATGFDLAIAADGHRVLGTYHWEPAPGFAVRLAPRAVSG
ncbi:MAG: cytochrome P450 [Geminicoccaceae bacterium]